MSPLFTPIISVVGGVALFLLGQLRSGAPAETRDLGAEFPEVLDRIHDRFDANPVGIASVRAHVQHLLIPIHSEKKRPEQTSRSGRRRESSDDLMD